MALPTAEQCISSRLKRFVAKRDGAALGIDAADHDGVGRLEHGDARGEPRAGGEVAQHRKRDIPQRDLRDDEIAEPREREAEAVAARHARARIGHEAVAEQRLQDRERAALGGPERAAQLRERQALRAGVPERAEHEDSALHALHAIAVIRHVHSAGEPSKWRSALPNESELTPALQLKAFAIIASPFGTAESSASAEVAAKLAQVRALLADLGARAIVLTTSGAVAWLTAGLENRIEAGSPASAMWVVVITRRRARADHERRAPAHRRGARSRGSRARAWRQSSGSQATTASSRRRASSPAAPRRRSRVTATARFGIDAGDALAALRLALVPREQDDLAALALDAARALEATPARLGPGERDFDLQARIAAQLERTGAFGACLIVGGDERVERFRHPLATGAPVRRLAMAVVVAERGGPARGRHALRLQRWRCPTVCARPGAPRSRSSRACSPRAGWARAMATCCRPATRPTPRSGGPEPGASTTRAARSPTGSESSRSSRASARASGTGSASRPGTRVAWNPSVAGGGKSEDTFLVEDDGAALPDGHRRVAADVGATGAGAPRSSTSPREPPHEGRRGARPHGARPGAAAARRAPRASPTAPPSASRSRASRARACWPRSSAPPSEREIVVNRVSQGSGAMLLGESELREMAAMGAEAGLEVSLFTGPAGGLGRRRARALGRRRRARRAGARRARPGLRRRGHRAGLRGRHPQLPDRRRRPAGRAHATCSAPASFRTTASGRSR